MATGTGVLHLGGLAIAVILGGCLGVQDEGSVGEAGAPLRAPCYAATALAGLDNAMAAAMNDRGQVVGATFSADWKETAFLWHDGKVEDLGTLGGSESCATDINASGEVIGWSRTDGDEGIHAVLWQDGHATDLGTLGGTWSFATGINARGQVVGYSTTEGDLRDRAFLWEGGKMRELPTPGISSLAMAINDRGQVVGSYTTMIGPAEAATRAVLWSRGRMIALGQFLADAERAIPAAISNDGTVVVNAETLNCGVDCGEWVQAFLWQAGDAIPLGTLGGHFSAGVSVTPRGEIVGVSNLGSLSSRPFLWRDGAMSNLEGYVPPGPSQASDINHRGQILINHHQAVFLLTPR